MFFLQNLPVFKKMPENGEKRPRPERFESAYIGVYDLEPVSFDGGLDGGVRLANRMVWEGHVALGHRSHLIDAS